MCLYIANKKITESLKKARKPIHGFKLFHVNPRGKLVNFYMDNLRPRLDNKGILYSSRQSAEMDQSERDSDGFTVSKGIHIYLRSQTVSYIGDSKDYPLGKPFEVAGFTKKCIFVKVTGDPQDLVAADKDEGVFTKVKIDLKTLPKELRPKPYVKKGK